MYFRNSFLKLFLLFWVLHLPVYTVFAQDESMETAEKRMIFQLDALISKDHRKFIQNGNDAFKQFMDEYSFDSLIMQRRAKILKGYKLEYLGDIRSIGM